jgi:alanine racemase
MTVPPETTSLTYDALAAPRVWLEVDLAAIQRNFAAVAAAVAPLQVMAVLKANAYGLGMRPIAEALRDAGAAAIGVAELREALAISDLGLPIQILGGLLREEMPEVVAAGIIAPVGDETAASALAAAAAAQGRQASVAFLVDTGMGRLGLLPEAAPAVIRAAAAMPALDCVGIYSHFPHAFGDPQQSERQVAVMRELVATLAADGISFRDVHIANSDGINNIASSAAAPFTMARCGINHYGAFDVEGARALAIEPVLALKSRLVAARELPAGATISYGATCALATATRVGTVAVGYADGFPLAMSNRGAVSIHGVRCPVLGRVCMDYITVSLAGVPEAVVGDDVLCLGGDITVGDWAAAKGTNPYEVICAFGNRVVRRYLGAGAQVAPARPLTAAAVP